MPAGGNPPGCPCEDPPKKKLLYQLNTGVSHWCFIEGVVRAAGMRFVNHWDGLGPRIEATHLIPTKPPGPKARLVKNKASLQNGW